MAIMNGDANNYLYYEKQQKNSHNRRCIDGRIIGSSKCVGYCKCEEHSGYLTKKHMKDHNCIKKECFHYLPKIKEKIEKDNISADDIVKTASKVLCGYEGVRITRASKEINGGWILRYATITNEYKIPEMERMIEDVIGEVVTLVKLNCDFDLSAKLVFSI